MNGPDEPTWLRPRPATDINWDAIGQAAYDAGAAELNRMERWSPIEAKWAELEDDGRTVWTFAAMAAVRAYDAQLTGQADALAELVAAAPQEAVQAEGGQG